MDTSGGDWKFVKAVILSITFTLIQWLITTSYEGQSK